MKVVGAVSVFNEEDIIEEVLQYYLSEGIDLVVLDDGSTDSTYDICKKFSNEGLIKLFQHKTKNWHLNSLLRMKYDLALRESPDWILFFDADQFMETGIDHLNLSQAIEMIDKNGFNIIHFESFEFFITNDDIYEKSIRKSHKYYSFQHDFMYRAWKFFPGIEVEGGWGHYPIYPIGHKYKIYSKKFIARHYPYRNEEQAKKKLMSRMERTKNTAETQIGLHAHIRKQLQNDRPILVDHKILSKYHEDNVWVREPKFSYFSRNMPKFDEIFFPDGSLRLRPKTVHELKLAIKAQAAKINNLESRLRFQKSFPKK